MVTCIPVCINRGIDSCFLVFTSARISSSSPPPAEEPEDLFLPMPIEKTISSVVIFFRKSLTSKETPASLVKSIPNRNGTRIVKSIDFGIGGRKPTS